jgi:hypothetical protein
MAIENGLRIRCVIMCITLWKSSNEYWSRTHA